MRFNLSSIVLVSLVAALASAALILLAIRPGASAWLLSCLRRSYQPAPWQEPYPPVLARLQVAALPPLPCRQRDRGRTQEQSSQ